jgi:aminoglycoside phosphotransferase (APT) family kinase protein
MDEHRLTEFISSQSGEPVEVRSIRRKSFGPSRDTYLVDSSVGDLVVRAAIDGPGAMWIIEELELMRSLSDAGVPVATVRWSDPRGDVFGLPFFVEDRVDVAPVDDDPGSDVAATFVQTLSRLHKLKPEAHLPAVDVVQATATQIERWRSVGKSAGGSRVPLLDAAEIWLHKHVPLTKRASVVHGQPDPGSNLVSGSGLAALTGLQHAHVGDAAEDWVYLANHDEGLARSREWRALIERETGARFSADEWSYWQAFNLFKTACINRTYLAQFESGANRSPELLVSGTAVYHSCLRRLMDIVQLV